MRDSPDAAMIVITAGIAEVVLAVVDDGIVPADRGTDHAGRQTA